MGLGGMFGVFLELCSMIFLLCSTSAFDMGDVRNVYELGEKYASVLHGLYQEYVGL